MIDGTEWFAAIALPYIGYKVLQVGDAVALAVALVVQSAALIDAICGHAMATKATIAAIALVDQWIATGGAFDHAVQIGYIALATIIA